MILRKNTKNFICLRTNHRSLMFQIQIMHQGAFDDELATVALMDDYLEQNGYINDMNEKRLHHEIYISDPRKVAPEKWKTVIRHPIRKR